MGFKIAVEVDVDGEPDLVGETLRKTFFNEKTVEAIYGPGHRELGCYESFDWAAMVIPQGKLPADSEDHTRMWTRAILPAAGQQIECRWFWDGDGVLAFGLPTGQWLINRDCKHTYGWELLDSEEEL